jgi:long-chain acyl-CoA synthetase
LLARLLELAEHQQVAMEAHESHTRLLDATRARAANPSASSWTTRHVVLKPNANVTAGQLRDHVKGQIAAYKYPRRVRLVDELPKGPTGKILKREISVPAFETSRC